MLFLHLLALTFHTWLLRLIINPTFLYVQLYVMSVFVFTVFTEVQRSVATDNRLAQQIGVVAYLYN